MRAETFSDILKAGDRVAVSNITGREASTVSAVSQKYCGNIVGGWALGKGGENVEVPGATPIPVFATVEDLMKGLPSERRPNKVVVYSPPPAVYGDVKETIEYGGDTVETVFVITEHVSVEVTSKVAQLCRQSGIDVLGSNTLGFINVHDSMRVGAVGGDDPAESFRPGGAAIISNSGNMVNTMAAYLQSAGVGVAYGVSTGKDVLILTPLKDLLQLALADERVHLIVLYVEPGGLYEKEAVEMLREAASVKPVIVYVTGSILATRDLSLGHAGAVVEGGETNAEAKMQFFDDYFGTEPYSPGRSRRRRNESAEALARGIRITTLHHLPGAAALVMDTLKMRRDFRPARPLALNPWFVDMKGLGKYLPSRLVLHEGRVPEPYATQVSRISREDLGMRPARRSMRNASHASSNTGAVTRIYGRSIEKEMEKASFVHSLFLAWTGQEIENEREADLLNMCLIASLTNGPGTISAQGAKLSTSAGNAPNTAMIATLATIGNVHGGNGQRAVEYLLGIFARKGLEDPWNAEHGLDLDDIVDREVARFSKEREQAKEAGIDYARIPCLGHPVFRNDEVNYDPRERVIAGYLERNGMYNIFLDFYHRLAHKLKEIGIARNVWAVNVDGAIASVALGLCWRSLRERRMTVRRASDLAFVIFALGRAAGGAAEFLDHQDYGEVMDMRIPVSECISLSRARD